MKIAVIGGDGIGPEVVKVGTEVLGALAERFGFELELKEFDLNADRYLRDGTTFPDEARDEILETCDAVLLGALGDPRVPDMKHARDIIFGMRFGFDLYANMRPVYCMQDRLMPLKGIGADEVDFVVFRENTEGLYAGVGGEFKRGTPDEVAIQESINTRKGVERIIRTAFEFAKKTGRKTVHLADKHNALRHAHDLWYRTFFAVAAEYPEIEAHHVFVDALCLYLVQDSRPFEVIVTCNLFGDIVTDLAAGLQGGLGMAASANVHPGKIGLFEPVHGSAPPLAGKDEANPIATILTVGLMLEHLGYPDAEKLVRELARRSLEEQQCTKDVGGELGTTDVGAWFVRQNAG